MNYNIEKDRNLVSSAFTLYKQNIPEVEWKGDAGLRPEVTKALIKKPLFLVLVDDYAKLSSIRNDIDHSGMTNNYMPGKNFEDLIDTMISSICEKVLIY